MRDYNLYWEKCRRDENLTELYGYLDMYRDMDCKEIDIFKENNVVNVCDAACGFGAYTLALATNGFKVYSFDISNTAVEITKKGLQKYGIEYGAVKIASILSTGYTDGFFDGIVAHAVIDHLTRDDAINALKELFRITKENGLIWITFDIAEKEDYDEEHLLLDDGTMEYLNGTRKGLLFRPYDWDLIDDIIKGYNVIYRTERANKERVVILKNTVDNLFD